MLREKRKMKILSSKLLSDIFLERVLQLVSENVPHTYTHTHTARIEYERTAAALGCIPAVLH